MLKQQENKFSCVNSGYTSQFAFIPVVKFQSASRRKGEQNNFQLYISNQERSANTWA